MIHPILYHFSVLLNRWLTKMSWTTFSDVSSTELPMEWSYLFISIQRPSLPYYYMQFGILLLNLSLQSSPCSFLSFSPRIFIIFVNKFESRAYPFSLSCEALLLRMVSLSVEELGLDWFDWFTHPDSILRRWRVSGVKLFKLWRGRRKSNRSLVSFGQISVKDDNSVSPRRRCASTEQ
ncbi:hypothetical protein Tco_0413283 [Tanacetum coccineum]